MSNLLSSREEELFFKCHPAAVINPGTAKSQVAVQKRTAAEVSLEASPAEGAGVLDGGLAAAKPRPPEGFIQPT